MLTGPLDEQHRALGAKMGAFAGWDMPISYAGTIAEHTAVRERVGLFDVSHLGKVLVRGEGAPDFLDTQLTNRMADLVSGRARYSLICEESGGVIDDLIVYGLDDAFLVVPNAANRDAVAERLSRAAPDGIEVAVADLTTLAVQGPAASDIVASLLPWAKDLGYMKVASQDGMHVARSGYTGERGYEVFTSFDDAVSMWSTLLEAVRAADGEPCGLAARDTLRLEMGYPLHGNDIDVTVTPLESGLEWAVKLEGRTFPGSDALASGDPRTSLVGIKTEGRAIPRRGQEVMRAGERIGRVTSGTFSPTLRVGIGMARIWRDAAAVGDTVTVDIRGKEAEAAVVSMPFVDRSPK